MKKILTLSVVVLLIALTCVLPMFAEDFSVNVKIEGDDELIAGHTADYSVRIIEDVSEQIGSIHIKFYENDAYEILSADFSKDIGNAFIADFDMNYYDGVIAADTYEALDLPSNFFNFTIKMNNNSEYYGEEVYIYYSVELYDIYNNYIDTYNYDFSIFVRCPAASHSWDNGYVCAWSKDICRILTCTACGEQKYVEAHIVKVIPGKAATCTSNGYTDGAKCEYCGEMLAYRKIIPAGHKYTEWTLYSEATCTKNAVEACSCSVCFINFAREVEGTALGHKWSGFKTSAAGHYKVCTVCGEKSAVAAHVSSGAATETQAEVCTVCGYTITPALGHTHTLTYVAAKAATCTEEGNVAYYSCSGCHKNFSDDKGTNEINDVVVAVKGHTVVVDAAVAATCTVDGKTEGSHCSVCNTVIKAQTTVKATGHSFGEWYVSLAATATDDGIKERVCSICGIKEAEIIPATGSETTSSGATTAPETEPSGDDDSDTNVGLIIGACAGGVVLLGAAGWFFFIFKKKKKS